LASHLGQFGAQLSIAFFALADAFVMPSTGEGFGIVFLEAATECL
jgi:glycogen synthase